MVCRYWILQHQTWFGATLPLAVIHITCAISFWVFGLLFSGILNFSTCIEAVTLIMSFVCSLQFTQLPLYSLPKQGMSVIELWVLILVSASGYILKASACEVVSSFCVCFCPLTLCPFYWIESSRLQNSPSCMWDICVCVVTKAHSVTHSY